jgi:hypothetical protein
MMECEDVESYILKDIVKLSIHPSIPSSIHPISSSWKKKKMEEEDDDEWQQQQQQQ